MVKISLFSSPSDDMPLSKKQKGRKKVPSWKSRKTRCHPKEGKAKNEQIIKNPSVELCNLNDNLKNYGYGNTKV